MIVCPRLLQEKAELHSCVLWGAAAWEHTCTHTRTHLTAGETQPLRKAPAWMRRPCGATFGFGGKLVSSSSWVVGTVPLEQRQQQEQECIRDCSTKIRGVGGRRGAAALAGALAGRRL